MTHLTEDHVRQLAKLPPAALDAMADLAGRLPPEWWEDLAADLEHAERRGLTGKLVQEMHHDAKGRVHAIDTDARRRRQGRRIA